MLSKEKTNKNLFPKLSTTTVQVALTLLYRHACRIWIDSLLYLLSRVCSKLYKLTFSIFYWTLSCRHRTCCHVRRMISPVNNAKDRHIHLKIAIFCNLVLQVISEEDASRFLLERLIFFRL